MVIQTGDNKFGVATWIVDPTAGLGTHTTIASAISDASSGDNIIIREGTYTEDLTLKAGVNLTGFAGDLRVPTVTIIGKLSFSSSGTCSIQNLFLQTNSDFILEVSGASASIVYVEKCYFNCTNNTGISFSSSDSASRIFILRCNGDLGTTGIGLFTKTSQGDMTISYCSFNNSGASTTPSSNSNARVLVSWSSFALPFSTSTGGLFALSYCNINTSSINTTCLTTAGTGTSQIDHTDLLSGTASALSVGTGTTVTIAPDVLVSSSNANALDGLGTIEYGLIVYTGSSSTNNVTTQTQFTTQPSLQGWDLIQTQSASASATLDFTTLPIYTTYAFQINNLLLTTTAQQLLFRISNDNGVTFATTGYMAGINYTSYNSATVTNVNSTTEWPLTSNANNGVGISGLIFCTVNNANFWGTTSYLSTDSSVNAFGTTGGAGNLIPNAFRFLSSSGNLTSGTVTIFGLRN